MRPLTGLNGTDGGGRGLEWIAEALRGDAGYAAT